VSPSPNKDVITTDWSTSTAPSVRPHASTASRLPSGGFAGLDPASILERGRDQVEMPPDGENLVTAEGIVAQRSELTPAQRSISQALALPEPPGFFDFTPIADQESDLGPNQFA
jgi:hypothetical protein